MRQVHVCDQTNSFYKKELKKKNETRARRDKSTLSSCAPKGLCFSICLYVCLMCMREHNYTCGQCVCCLFVYVCVCVCGLENANIWEYEIDSTIFQMIAFFLIFSFSTDWKINEILHSFHSIALLRNQSTAKYTLNTTWTLATIDL